MDLMVAVRRIEKMEKSFDACVKAGKELSDALEGYKKVLGDMTALIEYYDGGAWREDFELDEAGKLPKPLKRGVLSEDGLGDLLDSNREMTLDMLKLLTEMAERRIR
ncbi:MAG: DUF4298 domain-containing protein [Clostridia bacterium]|nr:DUF4298 domain-containing protein [Clostridia bacterium]